MDKSDDEDSGFSLDGLPDDFGQLAAAACEAQNFPSIPGYRITKLLGQGGMGAVYEAMKLDQQSIKVAVKTIFLPRFQTIADATHKRFERETELLSRLKHPNIVPILEQGSYEREYQRVPFFTMPLIENGDLADALLRNPIHTRDELSRWIDRLGDMLEGLSLAHRIGIVHRDIKPRNLFVDTHGNLLLGDFGLAKILHDESELTSTIGHMGTTPYAPPEQLLSAKLADSRADIYAIGVILHQFACFGVRPFAPCNGNENSISETDSIARWQRSTDRTAPKPSSRVEHLSDPSLDFIVQKCLAYYPEHRYPMVEDLLADLRAWRRGEVVRGSWRERFRSNIIAPIRVHLLPITVAAAFLLTTGSIAAWYKYSSLSENVTSLEEDVGKERQKQLQASKKTEAVLRDELKLILPKLPGEALDFNVRRMVDPKSEFKSLGERAKVIANDLALAESTQFADRHSYWVIQRAAVQPTLRDRTFVDHVYSLLDMTEANLQLAESAGDESDLACAVSDLLRTRHLLLDLAWNIAANEAQDRYRDILDVDKVLQENGEALKSLTKLPIVEKKPALFRHLKLMLLEFDLYLPTTSAEEQIDICRNKQHEFSSDILESDGCVDLQPWYIAWYIFKIYFEQSTDLKRPNSERQQIVNAWYDLQIATPAPGREEGQNITYLKDLSTVDDLRGDVLRDLGRFAEAKEIYEVNWVRFEPVRTFFRDDPEAWKLSEVTLSSLIQTAGKEDNREDQLLYYGRQQKLLREKLAYVQFHPNVFSEDDTVEAMYDLASSLFWNARLIGAEERQTFLAEADSVVSQVLQADPKHIKAGKLQKSIRSVMK